MLLTKRIILVTLLACWVNLSFASEFQFMTHNTKGRVYKDENGELRGIEHKGRRAFHLELVREMMILLDHPKAFTDVPFARGLLLVQNEDNLALFNVTRKPSREDTVKWVGPLDTGASYFYELTVNPTGIQTLEDAKKISAICVLNGNVHDEFLKKEGFVNLYRSHSYTSCFQMLSLKRVTLTPSSVLPLAQRLKDAGISPQDVKRTAVFLFNTEGYLAFSKNIEDDVIRRWQNALVQLKESGKYDQLVQEYFLEK